MPESQSDTAESTWTDEQLMLEYLHGSKDALSQVFSRYQQPLFGFFRRRVPDPAQAEELMQETFLAVLRASSRYEPRALFRTYLYAIALKILHAHRRRAAFRGAFFGEPRQDQEPASKSTIESEILLRNALAKLERNDREILMLREYEQLSYTEIAELLHLPVNTVRSRLFRARSSLRDIFVAPKPSPASITPLHPLEDRA